MLAFAGNQAPIAIAAALLATIICSTDAFTIEQYTSIQNARTPQITSTRIHLSSNENPIDKREGMADAFAAFNSLSSLNDDTPIDADDDELKAEFLADMMGDLSDVQIVSDQDVLANFQKVTMGEEAAAPSDVDGIGSISESEVLTTEDVTNDIISQDLEKALNVESFMSNAFESAMADLGKGDVMGDNAGYAAEVAKSVMQDEDFKREIGAIFDQAAEEMKNDIEVMRKEQQEITEEARKRGITFEDSQTKRLQEAEASVSRLINKVAKETDAVQQAMEELERVKRESSNSSMEESALDLKRGGIAKQAALVGMVLFGSRAVTEALLVAGSPYGTDHFAAAAVQGIVALVCAAYFFLVKL